MNAQIQTPGPKHEAELHDLRGANNSLCQTLLNEYSKRHALRQQLDEQRNQINELQKQLEEQKEHENIATAAIEGELWRAYTCSFNEMDRANNEQKRADAEQKRADAEQKRADAEQKRADAEQKRADDEKKHAEEAHNHYRDRALRAEADNRNLFIDLVETRERAEEAEDLRIDLRAAINYAEDMEEANNGLYHELLEVTDQRNQAEAGTEELRHAVLALLAENRRLRVIQPGIFRRIRDATD